MKLYYSKGACSLAVRILINEMGLPCEYESVDLKAKKLESGGDYYKINPKGSVPALETNEGQILTENIAIQQYLADTFHATQLLAPIGDITRYHTIAWMSYVATELHKTFGALFSPLMDEHIKEKFFMPLIKHKLNFLNKQLEQHRYLVDNDFTLPDAYCFVMLMWLIRFFKMNLDEFSSVMRYYNTLKNRPSILKSLEEEKIV